MTTILRLVPLGDAAEEARLAALAPTLAAEAVPEGCPARVVVTDGHRGLSAEEAARLPHLGLVSSTSAGLEGIARPALEARGVLLANVGPALAEEVADLALMLLLAAWHDLKGLDAHARGPWAAGPAPLGRSLRGRRLGLLGLGGIGQAVARRAQALGLAVAYASRRPKDAPYPHEPSLLRLAHLSDALVVAVPGGPETEGMVSAEVLAALGPEGVLVNVGRGTTVDEEALIAALASGALRAAGLDVMRGEPRPDPRLLRLPNVVLTPHVGSATRETRAAMARLAVDNVAAFLAGRPLPAPA